MQAFRYIFISLFRVFLLVYMEDGRSDIKGVGYITPCCTYVVPVRVKLIRPLHRKQGHVRVGFGKAWFWIISTTTTDLTFT